MKHHRREPSARAALPLAGILALAAIFLLVPVAQAFANGTGKVEIEGTGSGEVVQGGEFAGTPAIACSYTSPGPATGTCENELTFVFGTLEGEAFKAVPSVGSEFVEWKVEEGLFESPPFCGTESECLVFSESSAGIEGGSENILVKAVFALRPPTFPLTVTKSGTGSGTVKGGSPAEPNTINCGTGTGCEHEYLENALVTLTHEEATGSEFVEWTGTACSGTGACEVTMSAAKSVGAVFNLEPVKFKLTVTKSGTGSGTVKGGSPAEPNTINCGTGTGCEHEYLENALVTLTHEAAGGFEFVEWTGGACTGSGACEVTMSAAKSVGAVFNPIPPVTFNLKIVRSGSGTGTVTSSPSGINCGSGCEHAYNSGTLVTLTASASAGSTFAGWSGAGCSGAGTCVVTMSAAKEATATFNTTPVEPPKTCANTPSLCPPPPPPPPPPVEQCLVPKLKGLSLAKARSALTKAHCTTGKVTKPKGKKGPLIVKSSKPGAGAALPADTKVDLKLGPKPKKKK